MTGTCLVHTLGHLPFCQWFPGWPADGIPPMDPGGSNQCPRVRPVALCFGCSPASVQLEKLTQRPYSMVPHQHWHRVRHSEIHHNEVSLGGDVTHPLRLPNGETNKLGMLASSGWMLLEASAAAEGACAATEDKMGPTSGRAEVATELMPVRTAPATART